MSLSKTLYLSAPYQTAYSITTDNSDLEKLLRMRYGRYLTDESEDGRQYRSVVISKYRRAFNMQCGEKLYRHYLDLVPYPTEEEEENFLAVLSRADQRRFLLGKMAVLNRKEYGYPTYTGWCTEHLGTDENVISFEECNENSIAFLTHSAPASEAIHTLSILFPKVKLTFAWEENKVALMDDEVVLHYEVYRYGELAESKSAIAGKTHWQYNGSLKKPLYCTPQEDNDYGEIPEGISAEDFEEPDAMPF